MMMTPEDLDRVSHSFTTFHAHFAPLFGRTETRVRSEQYLRGLLLQRADRRNAENIAEAVEGATPRTLQRFLTEAPWQHRPVIEALHQFLGPRLSSPDGADGVFILDESGAAKQGKHSVGVARQYSGTLGKVGNCQVGVYLAYASSLGHALLDGELYLPREWTNDPKRCEAATVPEGVRTGPFQTKGDLAFVLLGRAKLWGHLRGNWVTGDCVYGSDTGLRDSLDEGGWHYVLEVRKTERVFAGGAAGGAGVTRPNTAVPAWSGHGRQPHRERLVPDSVPPQSVADVAKGVPDGEWQTLTVAQGAQGERRYQFFRQRVWECREDLPGRECWLLLRRKLDGTDLKYCLSNAPLTTPLLKMGQVGASRWHIETEFELEKSEAGLVEYEVRSWTGWYHHMTMALLAGAFLLQMQQEWGGKHAPNHAAAGEPGSTGATAQERVEPRGANLVAA
jgi:SRSO17 transposase